MAPWRFDTDDVASMAFDEEVQALLPAVTAVVERALAEILEDPLANMQAVVAGEVVYIKRLNPSLAAREVVPALLLVYSLTQRNHLIRKLVLCRAADVTPAGLLSTDEQIYSALERIVATALRRARQHDH
jgi:hypothetical protein